MASKVGDSLTWQVVFHSTQAKCSTINSSLYKCRSMPDHCARQHHTIMKTQSAYSEYKQVAANRTVSWDPPVSAALQQTSVNSALKTTDCNEVFIWPPELCEYFSLLFQCFSLLNVAECFIKFSMTGPLAVCPVPHWSTRHLPRCAERVMRTYPSSLTRSGLWCNCCSSTAAVHLF
jgi:hypothetical protein